MLVIGIDTSGKTASCALCSEEAVLAHNTVFTRFTHSQVILPMVKRMLADAGKSLSDADGFAVVSGPGSYTGLRIGISAVKGICMALDKECAGVSALCSLAYNFAGTDSVVCSVMHARQQLVYTAMFETSVDGGVRRLSPDEIVSLDELACRLSARGGRIICAGDHSHEAVRAAKAAGSGDIFAAPPSLGIPSAVSLCYAAMAQGFGSADDLNAEYMQITKAEKELRQRQQELSGM